MPRTCRSRPHLADRLGGLPIVLTSQGRLAGGRAGGPRYLTGWRHLAQLRPLRRPRRPAHRGGARTHGAGRRRGPADPHRLRRDAAAAGPGPGPGAACSTAYLTLATLTGLTILAREDIIN